MAAKRRRTHRDPVLGPLAWREDLGCWDGHIALRGGRDLELVLSPGEEPLDGWLAGAGRRAKQVRAAESKLRRFAAGKLLQVHNDLWNEGAVTTPREFLRRLTPVALHIAADGAAELYYDDGDLFWGHAVLVVLSARGQPLDALLVM